MYSNDWLDQIFETLGIIGNNLIDRLIDKIVNIIKNKNIKHIWLWFLNFVLTWVYDTCWAGY